MVLTTCMVHTVVWLYGTYNLRGDLRHFPTAMAIIVLAIPGYRMDGGFATPVWLVAESLSQLLQVQPDKQLAAANIQLLADPP